MSDTEPSLSRCGIADCQGDHDPQDHNAVIESEFERENAEMTARVQRWQPVVDAACAVSDADLSVYDDVPNAQALMDALDRSVVVSRGDLAPDDPLRTHDGWDIVEELRSKNERLCADLLTVTDQRDELRAEVADWKQQAEGVNADLLDVYDTVALVKAERDAWAKQTIHAKAQRDRAIYKAHQLGANGWHPDQEGPYRNE